MASILYYLAGFLTALATCYKLSQVSRRERTPGLFYICGVLAGLALSAVLLAPETLKAAAAFEPVPNLTRLVGNCLTLLAVFSMVGVLTHAAEPVDHARCSMRAQLVILAVSMVAMNVLFFSAGTTRFTVDFVDVYGGYPLVAAYELVFLSYASWGLVRLMLFAHHVARQSDRQFLRDGLRMVAGGAVVGLGWSVAKIVATVLKATTRQPVPLEGHSVIDPVGHRGSVHRTRRDPHCLGAMDHPASPLGGFLPRLPSD